MSNPLYQMLSRGALPGRLGNAQNMMRQFQQFRQTFRGDARQQIQQMLNAGTISQEQYNQAVQTANSFKQMLGF